MLKHLIWSRIALNYLWYEACSSNLTKAIVDTFTGSVEPKKYLPKAIENGDESKLFDCKYCDGKTIFSNDCLY